MDGKFNEVELLFVEEVLDMHGEYVMDLFAEDIMSKNLRRTDDLLNSISYTVGHYGIDPVLLISFFSYGRAIEINWHMRSKNSRRWALTNTNSAIWGIKQNRPRKRKKNTRWYTRNYYGSINRLLSILSTEFSNEEVKRLKAILERPGYQKSTGFGATTYYA